MESLQRTVLTLANSREAEREVGGQASHCYLASTKSRSSKTDKIVIFTFHINVTSEEEGKKIIIKERIFSTNSFSCSCPELSIYMIIQGLPNIKIGPS